MVLVVDDAEVAGGDTVDGSLWVDDKGVGRCLFQRAGEVFGGVTDFKCNVRTQPFLRPVGSKRPLVERDKPRDQRPTACGEGDLWWWVARGAGAE